MRAVEVVVQRHHQEQLAELDRVAAELRASIAHEVDRAIDRVVEFEIRSRKDIIYAGDQAAALESSRFASEQLVGAKPFRTPSETLAHGLSIAPSGGLALEFGVATGETLSRIAEQRGGADIYGFDCFDGLPEAWLPGMPAGTFARTDLPDVPGAELVVGLFDDTLPGFLDEHQDPVDFVHVDCDLYRSAVSVLRNVLPRMKQGGVIVFDEFFNYPGWQRHEYRAWTEYVEEFGVEFRYEAFTYEGNQMVVRLL
ncbi:MAG: class I SAM-dependent methyltransferase [Actinophytocola sp.]|nr:class I SAM-dependent methyltransferase [Actinophytocola sp.]